MVGGCISGCFLSSCLDIHLSMNLPRMPARSGFFSCLLCVSQYNEPRITEGLPIWLHCLHSEQGCSSKTLISRFPHLSHWRTHDRGRVHHPPPGSSHNRTVVCSVRCNGHMRLTSASHPILADKSISLSLTTKVLVLLDPAQPAQWFACQTARLYARPFLFTAITYIHFLFLLFLFFDGVWSAHRNGNVGVMVR